MEKSLIKDLIIENQDMIRKIILIQRDIHLSDEFNYVFVGLRRAGKSYLMYQQFLHLVAAGHHVEEMLFFNFEDDRLIGMTSSDFELIKTCYEEMFAYKPIFFLDEVQNIDGWEKFARRLADHQYRVYITGSNAKMLSSEIATTLGGRYMIQNVYPYSFTEFLKARDIEIDANWFHRKRNEVVRQFEDYFYFGGLPELQKAQDAERRMWLSNLYNKIFFGDLVSRYSVRNSFALKTLVLKLAESVKQPSSYSRLTNIISSAGKKVKLETIIDYLSYLRDTWLTFSLDNLASKFVERETNKKYYFIDNGILNLFLLDPNTSLLENIVAIQLKRKYGDEVYFYNKEAEVDFIATERHIAIQVSYSLNSKETEDREVRGLMSLPDNLCINQYMIITKEEERNIEIGDKQIHVVPVWRWLIDDK
jgi:predicted AAA+ superfamily ATPase